MKGQWGSIMNVIYVVLQKVSDKLPVGDWLLTKMRMHRIGNDVLMWVTINWVKYSIEVKGMKSGVIQNGVYYNIITTVWCSIIKVSFKCGQNGRVSCWKWAMLSDQTNHPGTFTSVCSSFEPWSWIRLRYFDALKKLLWGLTLCTSEVK